MPPGELVSALHSDVAKDALVVTFETNLIALALILLLGTPTAYWAATRRSRLRDLVVTLIELPLVLPPAVAGIGLLAAFGRLGLLGGTLDALGIDVAFNKVAVVSKSPNKAAAQAWVRMVLSAKGQTALKNAGFLPLPKASS